MRSKQKKDIIVSFKMYIFCAITQSIEPRSVNRKQRPFEG